VGTVWALNYNATDNKWESVSQSTGCPGGGGFIGTEDFQLSCQTNGISPCDLRLTAGTIVPFCASDFEPSVPYVTIGDSTGTGADACPVVRSGKVDGFAILSGGTNYSNNPLITIVSNGAGSGATAHAVVQGGVITSLVVDNGGSGYPVCQCFPGIQLTFRVQQNGACCGTGTSLFTVVVTT
jgi:hypothetical protein